MTQWVRGAEKTYEISFGGLSELLLGALADGSICAESAECKTKQGRQRRSKWHTGRESPLQHLVDIHDCGRAGRMGIKGVSLGVEGSGRRRAAKESGVKACCCGVGLGVWGVAVEGF